MYLTILHRICEKVTLVGHRDHRGSKEIADRESSLNARLDGFVAVVYGAVLSFGFYIFATSLRSAFAPFELLLGGKWEGAKATIPHFQSGVLFLVTTHFLICDYAGMAKVNTLFPYQRRTRFFLDTVIAVLYLMLFQSCVNRSVLFPFEFALLLFFCSSWGNNLHMEASLYTSDSSDDLHRKLGVVAKTTADNWGMIIRDSHALGGFFLCLVTLALLVWNDEAGKLARNMTLWQQFIVLLAITGWYVSFVIYAVRSSKSADHLLVPGYMPGWARRWAEKALPAHEKEGLQDNQTSKGSNKNKGE